MNWDALGAIAEIVGAIGVIVTLIYLAIQIKLNTKATKDESTRYLVLANSVAAMDAAKDAELTDLLRRGLHRPSDLTPTELMRYNLYFFSYYNQVDYAYEQYRNGQLDERSWNKIAKEIPAYIAAPGGQKWWESDKERFSTEFVSYVEGVLAAQNEPPRLFSVPSPE